MTRLEEAEDILKAVLNECDIRATHYSRAMTIEHFLGYHAEEPDNHCDMCLEERSESDA